MSSQPSSTVADRSAAVAAARTGTVLQAVLAGLLGLALLAGAGFARIEAVHSAAHDARHAAGFPCH